LEVGKEDFPFHLDDFWLPAVKFFNRGVPRNLQLGAAAVLHDEAASTAPGQVGSDRALVVQIEKC